MNRRDFLGGFAALATTPAFAGICPEGQIKQTGVCTPKFADPLQGNGMVVTEHRPTLCLSADTYRLMTEDEKGRKTYEAVWDYAFWHGGRAAPYDIGTVVSGRCYQRQRVKHGTVIINWFICREAGTGRWIRHWSATRPIVDSGEYHLVIYHSEVVDSFETPPPPHSRWPLPF